MSLSSAPPRLAGLRAFISYIKRSRFLLDSKDMPRSQTSASQNHRLSVEGIIHRDNKIIPWELYWRDCYWTLCEKYWNTKLAYVIFTGTPGVGKSVFRSIIVWWQIQKAKVLKSTVGILFLNLVDQRMNFMIFI